MIRRQRNQLVRELWRLRSSLPSAACTADSHPSPDLLVQAMGSESQSHSLLQLEIRLKSALHSLLKRLDVEELESLLESVKSRGSTNNQCILLPQRTKSHAVSATTPSLATSTYEDLPTERLALKAWRWHELSSMDVIKCLPQCRHGTEAKGCADESYVCINPYHWARVVLTGERIP